MPGTVLNRPQLIIEAKTQDYIHVALVNNNTKPPARITPVTLGVDGAVTGSQAPQTITIDSVALPIDLLPGQFLEFEDANGSYLFEVSSSTGAGTVTEITGYALETIPDDATALFPCRVGLVQEYSTSDTTSTSSISTFEHTGNGQSVRGDSEQSVSMTIPYSPYNAGARTISRAKVREHDVYIENQIANPDAGVFTTNGLIEWFVGKVTDVSRSGANGSELSQSVSITVDGGFEEVRPA